MKLSLLMAALLPVAIFAQQGNENTGNNPYPNTFSSGSADVHKFDNKSRFFNDWSLSVGGGAAFLAHGDVTSFYGNKVNVGSVGF